MIVGGTTKQMRRRVWAPSSPLKKRPACPPHSALQKNQLFKAQGLRKEDENIVRKLPTLCPLAVKPTTPTLAQSH